MYFRQPYGLLVLIPQQMLDFLAAWAEEKKKEEKVAKRALRDGGGQKPEEQGTTLRLRFLEPVAAEAK